jgi:hypothetical protein
MPKRSNRRNNSYKPTPRPEGGVPRFQKVMVGDTDGFVMEPCLANCNTLANKTAYPYFVNNSDGEYYLDPAIDPATIKVNRDKFIQYPDGVWVRQSQGGTKRRRRNHRNNSHKHRRRSGSKTRKR